NASAEPVTRKSPRERPATAKSGICSANDAITDGIAHVASVPTTTSGSVKPAGSNLEKSGPDPKRDDDDAQERIDDSAPICVNDSPAPRARTGWNVFVTALRPLMKNMTSTPTQTAIGRRASRLQDCRSFLAGAAAFERACETATPRAIKSAPTSGVAARTKNVGRSPIASPSPPPSTPAAMLPSPVAPENQPIAAAVETPPGGRATSSASCAVVATDQPRPLSPISSAKTTGSVTKGTSANAAAESAPPASR